ncbi:MAG: HAD family hydrolase [Opitutales bacterium]
MHTVLFDLDGTLIDHFTTIHRAYAHAQRTLDLPVADYDTVRQKVGGSIQLTMKRLIGEDPRYDEAIRIFKEHFAEIMFEDVEILPGTLELCAALKEKGHQLAVFTNKFGPHAREICEHLGYTPYMDLVIGAEDTPYRKPYKEYSEIVLERLGIPAQQAIMVGDSPFDVEAARVVNMHAAYVVATGSHTVEQLKEETDADGIFADMPTLAKEVFEI